MQAYAAKLIDLIESKAENIAKQWAENVMKHNRTPSYHSLPKEMVIEQGTNFYKLFRRMSLAENPYEEAKTFSWKYAEDFYRKKIPLQEATYALMLMRRNLWLYAEFQGTFFTAVEIQQAVESLNRTILMFDYVSYQVIEKYQALIVGSVERRLGAIKTLMMKGQIAGIGKLFKTGLMIILLIAAGILIYYNHAILKTEGLFTHLFYIPVILASIWWGKKGIFAAIFLGVLLLTSHLLFLTRMPISGDVVRAVMFVVIGGVIGWLMEGIKKVEELY
ncbi:multi-sensor signal transduction histidine kinase [Smithella sp. ME-1]|uniref:Sensory transduction histidine kinase n=1 Tax=hydrocarbon metagenome TaxID=938273 RepID=A0A0W8FN47_9ZZZZ|nr:multi-sensor signal transduction histidine kinase [Smithella sp. ME-1]